MTESAQARPTGTPPASELRPIGVILLASLVLWQLPFGGFLLYPFKLLGTWFHEGSHGLVMLATGTGLAHLEVFRDGSGLAHAGGDAGPIARAAIAAAGYMGAPLWGVAIHSLSRTPRSARVVIGGLGALVASSAIAMVSNSFGQIALSLAGGALLASALLLPARAIVIAAHGVAAQACINAVVDIRVLFRPSLIVDGKAVRASDAHSMASATFGTTDDWAVWVWAAVWLAWSLALLYAMFWITRRREELRGAGERDQ